MDKSARISLRVAVIVVAALALLGFGVLVGRSGWALAATTPAGMMSGLLGQAGGTGSPGAYAYGMMDGTTGYGMMGGASGAYGMMGGTTGYGMMGGAPGAYGMMGGGMMGSGASSLYGIKPLTIAQARTALQGYLDGLNNPNLVLGEIMIFDNQAYAEIMEKDSGIGAMEVLVDPVTLAVSPEPGPNMMWNTKYSPMAGAGHGMMGYAGTPQAADAMAVSPTQAVEAAQQWLNVALPGTQADSHADRFYGYYTIHIERDGKTVGMLSVNGTTRQVFLHTWHGNLVEMTGE